VWKKKFYLFTLWFWRRSEGNEESKDRTVVCFLLGKSPVYEFYMMTFLNTLSILSSWAGRFEEWTRFEKGWGIYTFKYPTFLRPSSFFKPTCLWRWNRQTVSKRRHIKFRREELPRRKHTTFRTRRKFEIKNDRILTMACQVECRNTCYTANSLSSVLETRLSKKLNEHNFNK
jgi:hypothetical protein